MFRKNLALLTAIVILILSACAPTQPTVTLQSPTDLPASTPTLPAVPTATQSEAQTPTPPENSTAAGSLTTFTLVPEESVVSYAVDETFLNENNRLNTAVGKTSQVNGEFKVDLQNPSKIEFGEFTVDISTLQSDSSRRDGAIQRQWLESSRFPLAKFTPKELVGFPASPQEGQPLNFQMLGDLTVHDTTRPVTWDVTANLNSNRLTGTATTFIMMADWGVTPPNIAGILIVKDGVTLTLNFTFEKQS